MPVLVEYVTLIFLLHIIQFPHSTDWDTGGEAHWINKLNPVEMENAVLLDKHQTIRKMIFFKALSKNIPTKLVS